MRHNDKVKTGIFIILFAGCILNLILSGYITVQKNHNDAVTVENCFAGDGGCYQVQTSAYAKTFGILNPHYGFFFFGLGTLLFGFLLLNVRKKIIPKIYYKELLDIIQFFLIIGAIFSVWLLYAQFFLIFATCIYCLLVDTIMIAMAVIFSTYKKSL